MSTWKEYIDDSKNALEGKKIEYHGDIYTVAAVDYNGMVHIDKPSEHNETTAVYSIHEARKRILTDRALEQAKRIFLWVDPWNRESTIAEIAHTIQTDPETVISYLMDIIEELTA